jgi:hypothetical protein
MTRPYVYYKVFVNGDRVCTTESEDLARQEAAEFFEMGYIVTLKRVTEEVLLL